MRNKIGVTLLISLMLSLSFMPLVVAADDGKSIIKEMVQAPADYSVSTNPIWMDDRFYRIYGGDGIPFGWNEFLRGWYYLDNRLYRIWD